MNNNEKYGFSGKWSPEIEIYGFTQVPNLLLTCQGHLQLSDGEITTLIQLMSFWFEHDGKVYPSIARLARYPSKGYSTIQKRLKSLEKKGFIKRRRKLGSPNTYDLKLCAIRLYEHQKICPNPPHRRGDKKVLVRTPNTSFPTYKEYELKRRSKNTMSPISHVLKQRAL